MNPVLPIAVAAGLAPARLPARLPGPPLPTMAALRLPAPARPPILPRLGLDAAKAPAEPDAPRPRPAPPAQDVPWDAVFDGSRCTLPEDDLMKELGLETSGARSRP